MVKQRKRSKCDFLPCFIETLNDLKTSHILLLNRKKKYINMRYLKRFRKFKLNLSIRWKSNPDVRRRQWHPTPVLLPRKSHGRRSLVGCSPWDCQSQTRLSDFTLTFHFHALEKEMATHSSVLAWRIPGTGSRVGCCLWGRTESDTIEVTQQQPRCDSTL